MGDKKTKVVLDADVINHFSRAGRLSLLPNILPEFQFIVLDIVKKELPILILADLDKVGNVNIVVAEHTGHGAHEVSVDPDVGSVVDAVGLQPHGLTLERLGNVKLGAEPVGIELGSYLRDVGNTVVAYLVVVAIDCTRMGLLLPMRMLPTLTSVVCRLLYWNRSVMVFRSLALVFILADGGKVAVGFLYLLAKTLLPLLYFPGHLAVGQRYHLCSQAGRLPCRHRQ